MPAQSLPSLTTMPPPPGNTGQFPIPTNGVVPFNNHISNASVRHSGQRSIAGFPPTVGGKQSCPNITSKKKLPIFVTQINQDHFKHADDANAEEAHGIKLMPQRKLSNNRHSLGAQ